MSSALPDPNSRPANPMVDADLRSGPSGPSVLLKVLV